MNTSLADNIMGGNQRLGNVPSTVGSALDSIGTNSVHVTSSQQNLLAQLAGPVASTNMNQSQHISIARPPQQNGQVSSKDINVSILYKTFIF